VKVLISSVAFSKINILHHVYPFRQPYICQQKMRVRRLVIIVAALVAEPLVVSATVLEAPARQSAVLAFLLMGGRKSLAIDQKDLTLLVREQVASTKIGSSATISDSSLDFTQKSLKKRKLSKFSRYEKKMEESIMSDKDEFRSPRIGQESFLLIRVNPIDARTTLDLAGLSDRFWGTSGFLPNVVSVLESCSYGKVKVLFNSTELEVNKYNNQTARLAVYEAYAEQRGVSLPDGYDHVIMVFPSKNGIVGASASGVVVSLNEGRISTMIIMHEIGHTFSLGHTGENGCKYADESNYMGYTDYNRNLMCFNGPHNWHLGWYKDKHATANPTSSLWSGFIVGLAEYDLSSDEHYIVVLIPFTEVGGNNNYFVSLNRKKDGTCNSDTKYGANKIMVHEQQKVDRGAYWYGGQTWVMAKMNAGESYQIPSSTIVVEVVSIDESVDPWRGFVKIYTKNPVISSTPSYLPSLTPSGSPSLVDCNNFASTTTSCAELDPPGSWGVVETFGECVDAQFHITGSTGRAYDHSHHDNSLGYPCGCTYHKFGTVDYWGLIPKCNTELQCFNFRGGEGDLGCYCKRLKFNDNCVESSTPSHLPSLTPSVSTSHEPSSTLQSFSPSGLPSSAPSLKDPCVNLKKRKCKNECFFTKRPKKVKLCLVKKKKFEHDCSQYTARISCREIDVCKFVNGKCFHSCDGLAKQKCIKAQFCMLTKIKVKNPCLGCRPAATCSSNREYLLLKTFVDKKKLCHKGMFLE